MCDPECPNEAITFAAEIYEIDPALCTECVGFYERPTCMDVCPIKNCIIIDPDHIETQQQLLDKFAEIYTNDNES